MRPRRLEIYSFREMCQQILNNPRKILAGAIALYILFGLAGCVTREGQSTPSMDSTVGPSVTSTVVSIDPAIVAAQVDAISDALLQGDISLFDDISAERIGFRLYKSEIWDYYPKSEFLHEISLRIQNHPVCLSYEVYGFTFTPNLINIAVFVFAHGWDPDWDLDGVRQADTVVFDLVSSDGEEFLITGAYLHDGLLPFGDLPCP